MAERHTARAGQRPTHRRSRRSSASEERLRALGERIPVTTDELEYLEHQRVVRHRRYFVGAVAVVLVVLATLRWFGPVPSPKFSSAVSTSVRLPGALPSLPWPTMGAATLSVEGAGSLGSVGNTQPAAVAGLATVMTAYVVLEDHPLTSDTPGPVIPVSVPTIAAAQAEAIGQESAVPVSAGESLTELQALEGLLVAQGNDMATLLADWDAGSETAFVAKLNASARTLGLDSTTFTDPSGLDPGTVSTPANMISLGEAAMSIPVFAQIVAMPQVTLPLAGLVFNLDADLGQNGIVGIKTGSDSTSGGCFLFESQETVGGKSLTLVGAVLGQGGGESEHDGPGRRRCPRTCSLRRRWHLPRPSVTSAFGGADRGPMGTVGPGDGRVIQHRRLARPDRTSAHPRRAAAPGHARRCPARCAQNRLGRRGHRS